MIQPQNRHMSFSLYICVLAVADTFSLAVGKFLNLVLENSIQDKNYAFLNDLFGSA